MYDGESKDVRLEGECTNTLKDGILARQTGPDGPVSMKCLSASPNPRRFNLLQQTVASNCDVVVSLSTSARIEDMHLTVVGMN